MPPRLADSTMARVRVCTAVGPHEAAQLPHDDHIDTTQSMGQSSGAHASRSISTDGQGVPVPTAAVITALERVRFPPPQVVEHAPHLDQAESTQFCVPSGQAAVLHTSVCTRSSHATPPNAAATCTVRERDRCPPAQVTEQASHDDHGLSWQSRGQFTSGHVAFSSKIGHSSPPFSRLVMMVRLRDSVPFGPQLIEQADQEPHTDTAQSVTLTAHVCTSVTLPYVPFTFGAVFCT